MRIQKQRNEILNDASFTTSWIIQGFIMSCDMIHNIIDSKF